MVEHRLDKAVVLGYIVGMKNTKAIGDVTEGSILASLLKMGKAVLLPFGENHRYDMVVEDGGKFVRIQCKTGRLRNGAVEFNTCSYHYHRGAKKKTYHGCADVFGVYCPDNGMSYLVPVDGVSDRMCRMRVDVPKNNQTKGIRLAKDYEIAGIAQLEEHLIGNEKVAGSIPASGSKGLLCEHANEAPRVCRCPNNCECKKNMCK